MKVWLSNDFYGLVSLDLETNKEFAYYMVSYNYLFSFYSELTFLPNSMHLEQSFSESIYVYRDVLIFYNKFNCLQTSACSFMHISAWTFNFSISLNNY